MVVGFFGEAVLSKGEIPNLVLERIVVNDMAVYGYAFTGRYLVVNYIQHSSVGIEKCILQSQIRIYSCVLSRSYVPRALSRVDVLLVVVPVIKNLTD
jgi:hypothetical protein